MKKSARKLLIFLYKPEHQAPFRVSQAIVSDIIGELSPAGKRSLLYLLKNKQFIAIEKLGAESFIRITDKGKLAIQEEIPVLLPITSQQPVWHLILFKEALSTDKQFRFLRSLLIKQGCAPLTRGSYLYPGQLPNKVFHECSSRYQDAVVVISVKDWVFGMNTDKILEYYAVLDQGNAYSGISNQLLRLISRNVVFKELNSQDKLRFNSLFNHFCDLVAEDRGLIPVYYPTLAQAKTVLFEFQEAVK
ncbi:MAG: hypothetical protein M3Q81_02025 [bacterium]|nr:hypothetical protein [bacterium]